jgi:hypothetical protein
MVEVFSFVVGIGYGPTRYDDEPGGTEHRTWNKNLTHTVSGSCSNIEILFLPLKS